MRRLPYHVARGALLLLATCSVAAAAPPAGRVPSSGQQLYYGAAATAKATGDTVDLMGPGAAFPYRGDFETAQARPAAAGALTDGWTSIDQTSPANHWHVDSYGNPFGGAAAWCSDIGMPSCGPSDPVGGYANDWRDILEFRKTVGGAASVRVQADLQYDCEPGYDFTTLQRRTAAHPLFEPVAGGQGLSWDGVGTVAVDYTFTFTPAELVGGADIAIAFVFDSDNSWSDGDCNWPTGGACRVDNIVVTLNGVAYTEDFSDGELGPDWVAAPNVGVGDFVRVWGQLGDLDDCAQDYTKVVAFIDDGLVVPGTGGTIGQPGNDYGPPGGYIVNNTGGLLGPAYHLENVVNSPVMAFPDQARRGVTLAFDVYRHELLAPNDSPGIFYTWSIRSGPEDFTHLSYGWFDRNFVYYGGPSYQRSLNVVDDLIDPDATHLQVQFGVIELGWQFGYGNGTNGTPAPYFDNVSVKVYGSTGPHIVATEIRLANDGFPAIGDVDLVHLGANSVRFDMAANISAKTHLRNDPGDSIWIDVTARNGGQLVGPPVMHWTFARKNPLFNPYRSLPANPVVGNVTRNAAGVTVANRYNFDLPDTGMLFPGDVLQYYFAATDQVGADIRTAYVPADRSGLGNPYPHQNLASPYQPAYPGAFTVRCLPSVQDATGYQPSVLFWNDTGFRGDEERWHSAFMYLCYRAGSEYDLFTTHGPTSGVGNGLGGRATVAQLDGYTDMLYSSGDLGTATLSNGDFNGDPGNDLALLNDWFAIGGRDLFMTGDDLATSLAAAGSAGSMFLETRLGLVVNDGDVRDNIGGQVAPLVVKVVGNPVFATAVSWTAYGGCLNINDFDNVTPRPGAVRLAQFTAPDGVSAPYPYAAATLNASGGNRVVSMAHDFMYVTEPDKSPVPVPARVKILSNVLDYFWVANNPVSCWGEAPPVADDRFAVTSSPNPFNPSVTLRYTLPAPDHVTMKVFDMRGALVRTLLDGPVDQPSGAVTWNGRNDAGAQAASGLYFVETRAGDEVDVRKVTMLK
jgi:hypothetical protein